MDLPPPPWQRLAHKKPARQPLSQERVVDTALAVLERDGLDAVTMRRIAQELDTGPASLYAHVANKDELHQLMLDRVVGDLTYPEPDPKRWREQLKETIMDQVRVLSARPGVARLAMETIVPTGPNSLAAMEWMLGLLKAGGLPDRVAALGADLLATYTVAVAMERGAVTAAMADKAAWRETMKQLGEYMAALPADRFPHLLALGPLLNDPDTDRPGFGLEVILAGLAVVAEQAR